MQVKTLQAEIALMQQDLSSLKAKDEKLEEERRHLECLLSIGGHDVNFWLPAACGGAVLGAKIAPLLLLHTTFTQSLNFLLSQLLSMSFGSYSIRLSFA